MTARRICLVALAMLAAGFVATGPTASAWGQGLARALLPPAPLLLAPVEEPRVATPPAPLAPAEARRLLEWLDDPRQRAAFEQKLAALAHADSAEPAPAKPATAAPRAAPAPAPAQPAAQPAAQPSAATTQATVKAALQPDSVGAQVIDSASGLLGSLTTQAVATVRAARSLPLLWQWVRDVADNPAEQARLAAVAWRLAAVVAGAILADLATHRALRGVHRALDRIAPRGAGPRNGEPMGETGPAEDTTDSLPTPPTRAAPGRRPSSLTLLRRIPLVIASLLTNLVPIAVMLAVAYVLASTDLAGSSLTRVAILAAINAYAVARVAIVVVTAMVSPHTPNLRLVHVGDDGAAYLMRWTRRIVFVAAAGWAAALVGRMFGLSMPAHDALLKIVALIAHVMVGIVIVQKRRAVARWIRPREPRDVSGGVLGALRVRFASVWHWVALFYVIALWVVWAIELQGGYARLLHGFVEAVAVLIGARLLAIVGLGAIDRVLTVPASVRQRNPTLQDRVAAYRPAAHVFVYSIATLAALVVLLQFWGAGAFGFLAGNALGQRLLSLLISVTLAVLAAIAVWEAVNIGVEARVAVLARGSNAARATRLRTLLPMLRTALLVAILVVVGMFILSEIGVNIAPLLAGASVFGIAIGFGSQKLVQDVITGLFLLLENTMQVGDVVSLGGLSGVVENLSIRAIRLRAEDGSVHVIPFSAVTTVTNMTRDYSHAVVELTVGYRDDYDRVIAVMKAIVADMRQEPRWRNEILDELEVWGLNKFSDGGVTVKCRIRCGPFGRWSVGREFNRRLKERFEAERLYIVRQTYAEEAPPAPPPPAGSAPAGPTQARPDDAALAATAGAVLADRAA